METAKKVIGKFVLLAVVLVVLNYIYEAFFFERDLQKYSDVINLIRAVPDSADVIYIGESSNLTYRDDDLDKRKISDFLADYFPGLNVYDITKPAGHAGIYKVLLANIPESCRAQTVVVTLNLRSFNAQWIFSKLETPLQKSMVLLQPYPPLVNRFLLSFKAYDIKTEKEREQQFKQKWKEDILRFPYPFPYKNVVEWDSAMAYSGVKNAQGKYDPELTQLAAHYIKAYAFQIDTVHNPRIKDFDEIIGLARKRGWNLVLNLLAENVDKAQKLVGDDLTFLMEQNRQILMDYFGKRGVDVVDNLYAVPDEQFIDQDWTTEHYAERGRRIVARNVALELKKFYPDQFREVNYNFQPQTEFFNDCEKNLVWGQMGTLTDEEAYSGKYSSRTGNGNDYSITFEYPFRKIPDSLRSRIQIDFKVFQTGKTADAKLVIEAHGADMPDFWLGKVISKQVTEVNRWASYHYTFPVPDELSKAELIKIYVYNPTKTVIYIDDLGVKFQ